MGASAVSTDDSGASITTADIYPEADLHRLQSAVRVLLSGVGEDISREGLRDTPKVGYTATWVFSLPCKPLLSSTLNAESGQSLGGCVLRVQTGFA